MRRILEALLRLFVVVEHLLQRQQVLRSLRLQRRDALLKLPFLLCAFSLPVLKRLRASLLLPRPFLPDRILILLVLALELLLFLSRALRSLLRVLGILRSLGVLLRELFLHPLVGRGVELGFDHRYVLVLCGDRQPLLQKRHPERVDGHRLSGGVGGLDEPGRGIVGHHPTRPGLCRLGYIRGSVQPARNGSAGEGERRFPGDENLKTCFRVP